MLRSLRFKIVVILVLVNTVSFVAMILINYETSNKQMNRQLLNNSLSSLKITVNSLYAMLQLRMKEAELIAHSLPHYFLTTEQKLNYLRFDVPLASLTTRHVGVAARDGIMHLLDGNSVDMKNMEAYHAALKGISSYADLMLDEKGVPVLWLIVPYYDSSGSIDSVIGMAFDSAELFRSQLTLHANDYKDSSILLVDWDTNLLYYKDESLILKLNYLRDEPRLGPFVAKLRTSNEGYAQSPAFGRVVKIFYVRMPGMDWYAVFTVSKSEFEAPLRRSIWMNIGLVAVAEVLIGALLFFITQRMILDRLKKIVEVTKNVAAGNFYPKPLQLRARDEFGMLATSVNGMIENLQELFEPFQAFIRHNQYAMIVTDAKFLVTSFNKRAEELLGYSEREVVGHKALLLWHDPAQLRDRASYYSDKLKRDIAPDESVLFVLPQMGFLPDWEWHWLHRDGHRMLVSINTSIMRHPDGSTKGYVLIARDVSAIKKAVETNARLFEIMESAHDAIASFDMRGTIFYLNQAGHDFLGIDRLNEDNNRVSRYMPIPMTVAFADGLMIAQQQGFWQSEAEFYAPGGQNGASQIVSIIVVAHRPGDDSDAYFSAIVRDISAHKETERQLLLAKEEADEANLAKSSFLARMSHEIRTPLGGIIGLTHLLRRTELSGIQHDYIRQITDSSQALLHILNDVLDFSKLEADKLVLEREPFCPAESLHRLSGIFSVLLGPKPVDFILRSDPRIPKLVGDSTRLEQILLNLCSNAIKFTNVGLIELSVELLDCRDGNARLAFRVDDTGIGMTDEQLERLFKPFVQADEKTSRKFGGTGLGLVISRTLVEWMGGTLTVESRYRVGSSFRFELEFPLATDASNPVWEAAEPLELSVVVLEDEPAVAEHWRTLLYSLGCDAVAVGGWTQAAECLESRQADLFIVDMECGDMHGEETWSNWKESLDAKGIKTVCSTTLLGRDALQQLPERLKPAAVLVKPSSPLQVRQTLEAVCHRLDLPEERSPEEVLGTVSDRARSEKLRIVAVDDQVVNRLVVKQLLDHQGIEVELMESGVQALEALSDAPADLVLMDLHMPDMDGLETTIELRKLFDARQLPIIALTADVTPEQHAKCLAAGMNDILTKPIEPDKLYAAMRKWVSPLSSSLSAPTGGEIGAADSAVASGDGWSDFRDMPGMDTTSALERLDGKTKLYRQLLDKFKDQHGNTAQRLSDMLAAGDRDEAVRLAHSLAGAAGHLGMADVLEHASALQQALQRHEEGHEQRLKLEESLAIALDSIFNLLKHKSS
ncbi:response regulator [Cohnella suwonensis]|uniref:histidine kinase n=1 Tax=Cohnella suwonensis TaxID=696072 RepID=A0ABW0LRE3_9BACL